MGDGFPFTVPIIRALETLEFDAPVTFFVGENGSGKSTLLEGIAAAASAITVGSDDVGRDPTLLSARQLAGALKLTWAAKRRSGFFLRSEDFFGFVKRLAAMREAMQRDLSELQREYKDRPEALPLARMPYMRELHEMERRYGPDLDAYSHGESFFKLFSARFAPDALYLLDEPEAPLSPMRQIVFLAMVRELVGQNSQFIIATHSPILLAYPGATIYHFEGGRIQRARYDDLEHIYVMKAFLNDPEGYLARLMAE
jgi:predicted ATPase